MQSIRELENLLLPAEEQPPFADGGKGLRIVVLRQFRFHRSLCIELYDAGTTHAGKIKNPLSLVSASDAALFTTDPDALLFYTSISRFQNQPTAGKTAADIRALKTIIKNPLGLRFFVHDPEVSENISAASLTEVQAGAILHKVVLLVNKQGAFYQALPQLHIGEEALHPQQVQVKFDFFVLHKGLLHLAPDLSVVKLLQYFSTRQKLEVHEKQFDAFNNQVLAKLEARVEVVHTYIEAATEKQIAEAGLNGAQERIIYLSDLGQYVIINPVMRYGSIEVPIRSKKAVYLPDARGRMMAMQRDEKAEDNFLGFMIRQHSLFYEQMEDGLTCFYLHRDRFLDEAWFLDAFEAWRTAGISIFGFNQLKGNKLNANKASISVHVLSGLNWFNTKLGVRFGKQNASLKQLQQSVRNKSRFVQLDDGTLGILPDAWVERMSQFFFAAEIVGDDLVTPRSQFDTLSQLYQEEELDDEVKTAIKTYREKLDNLEAIEPVTVPKALKAHLRNYQLQGLSWLHFLNEQGFGGVLADDMGLGKTLQVIAFMLLLQEGGKKETHLVVVPTSLLFNWKAELARFAPTLQVLTHHGADRNKDIKLFDNYDVVLTSYGTLLSDISYLRRYPFGYVFLDESQQIKNIGSQRYHAARLLQSRNRLAITGTPIENNTLDLYAQISFVNPGLLGNKQYFRDVYSTPIDRFGESRRAAELQQKVTPFILRRTKEAVAQELPDKTEQVLYCPMGEAQRAVYEAYEAELRDYLEGKMQDEILRNSIHVLRGLTQLRQICNDPRLLKADQLQGQGSAKIEALMEQIDSKAGQHKILVFSQFVSMLDLLRAELERSGIGYAYLTGATRNREAAVDQFQNDPKTRVFLLSLKAGGTGLNLTAASYVYLVDPWWNPAVEAQAIDRAYRLGQHKNVQAIRLICPGTVEEKMMLLQEDKKALSAELVQTGADFFGSMTKEDWQEVLGGK
ncbi:Superfamily II DNA or RNA helicase, SNF2 family [Cnuella takakiae]|uniref:Superfamily II DNA or RNA helicase, SNF2 family n=1 Tax=Cnuella takakiae TaxID=1302690 RepID=A0A1M5ELS8_9BACT|nr:DEAD/DEAH box helicase [Cnuella takakiae]SHF80258.1 Superfamily II DNA or RNA helicase, SNF2 family [Cnuella takakiae]